MGVKPLGLGAQRFGVQPLFDLNALAMEQPAPHPARYSDVLYPVMLDFLRRPLAGAPGLSRLLDPFAGVGGIYYLQPWLRNVTIEAVEIQPRWACADHRITLGSALHLPWPDHHFEAICTSPTYGNRMADNFEASDGWEGRNTYRHKYGEALDPENSGTLQWGEKYRQFHKVAWWETWRVLQPGGRFVLNCKDHIRGSKRMHVTDWHVACLVDMGFVEIARREVATPGNGFGANGKLRLAFESVILLQLREKRSTGVAG